MAWRTWWAEMANLLSIDEGRPAMTQGIIVWVMLMGIVGLSWVIVLDILGNEHHPCNNR
jgi:hypothetical protein